MNEELKILAGVLGVILVVFVVIFVPLIWWGNQYTGQQCMARWANYAPRYDWVTGCMIEVDGKRIPSSAYRVVK